MIERLSLRLRVFLFFALIAVCAVGAIGWAGWFIAQQIPAESVSRLVLGCGTAMFAVIGITIWVWLMFDEHVARPIMALSSEILAAVHAGSRYTVGRGTGRYLGLLTPMLDKLITTLLDEREKLDQSIQEATDEAQQQKRQLESVLQDLHEGVLICNLEHRIMLYNHQAMELLHAEHLGLGRRLTGFLVARPLEHALERLVRRYTNNRHLEHRDGLTVLAVSATTDGEHQLQLRMALTLDDEARPSGYVLALEDVTEQLRAGLTRDHLLHESIEVMRRRVTNLALAAEVLLGADRDINNETREAMRNILRHEPEQLSDQLTRLEQASDNLLSSAMPMSDVLSSTLISCAAEQPSGERSSALQIATEGEPLWLYCDSHALVELIDRLINRVSAWAAVQKMQLVSRRNPDSPNHAFLELGWEGAEAPEAMLSSWLNEPLSGIPGHLSGHDVLHRHKSEFWSEQHDGHARILLALDLSPQHHQRPAKNTRTTGARPEFYDFDLAQSGDQSTSLHEMPLKKLTMVVFDSETTGLEPSKGDELLSVAGVRVVNGRMLRGEVFNEFIKPGRRIPAASTRVHGISDDMVADADDATMVLPRFHTFIADAVLVAHNAAFDMRFLSLQQDKAGVVFDQPVLDTVLLAAHLFGATESLTLDTLAERFEVTIAAEDRHTALGDALATAQVLIRLIEMLEAAGTHTLGEAIEVSNRQAALRRAQNY